MAETKKALGDGTKMAQMDSEAPSLDLINEVAHQLEEEVKMEIDSEMAKTVTVSYTVAAAADPWMVKAQGASRVATANSPTLNMETEILNLSDNNDLFSDPKIKIQV